MPQHNTPTGPYRHPDSKSTFPTLPRVGFGRALAIGLGAGVVGALSMATTSKLEQLLTHRPNSYVPARTTGSLLGVEPSFYARHRDLLNHAHHFGMAVIAGPLRAVMAYYGIIGPIASFVHMGIRIVVDQTVEIGTGVSVAPWTWPINEQVVDLLHKGVYAVVVGYACDYFVRGVDWFNW